eukprot:TRINITY_DN15025_c0_g1_i1.p1 TRINITY_DN15025_c0_g1~~TRINITY_DN15025_c0_g1_i1.p1  ORF type:complete len:153 (+),score=31.87 TRINITY_DN15025_c0_g1_i1:66-524(+)
MVTISRIDEDEDAPLVPLHLSKQYVDVDKWWSGRLVTMAALERALYVSSVQCMVLGGAWSAVRNAHKARRMAMRLYQTACMVGDRSTAARALAYAAYADMTPKREKRARWLLEAARRVAPDDDRLKVVLAAAESRLQSTLALENRSSDEMQT